MAVLKSLGFAPLPKRTSLNSLKEMHPHGYRTPNPD